MKRLTYIALIAALTVCLAAPAAGQVSVRRTPKKEKTEQKKDAKPATADKPKAATSTTKRNNASSKLSQPGNTPAAPPANVAKPAKPATPAKPAAQAKGSSVAKGPSGVNKNTPSARQKQAQQPLPEGKTLREQAFDDYQRRESANVPWQHVVYRELDLTRGSNASLYYPVEPMDGMNNMFRVIFDLLCTAQVKGYEYLDGREVFEDKYLVKPKDVFDKFQISYVEKAAPGRVGVSVFTVDENDVPAGEVLSYYVKERWEYDYATSTYGPHILALCPVIHRAGDFGGDAVKYPMMWLRYEDLRPFLRQHLIVSEGMNNAPRFTMEDFFALHQYDGDIYKVQNLRGLSLMQQYPNPDSLRIARARIEARLRGFSDSIWVPEPAPDTLTAQPRRARAARSAAAPAAAQADTVAVAPRRAAQANADAGSRRNRRTRQAVDMEAVEAEQDAKAAAEDENIRRTGAAHSVRRSRR